MKIVVTGASGFVGRHLVHCLALRGVKVIAVSRRNLPGTIQVRSYEDTPQGDVLIHIGEVSDRIFAQENAPHYELQALKTLESLLAKGFSRVIYSSSAVLYGDQGFVPRNVDDPIYETDAYTRLKNASEQLVLSHKGVVARLSNIYGIGMSDKNVLSTILRQLRNEGPIRIIDNGPVRDFLWVEDAVYGLADMAIGTAYGIFNLGSGKGVSIKDLVLEVLSAAGQIGRKVESNQITKKQSTLILNIMETQRCFGWYPTVSLKEGVTILVNDNSI